MKSLLCAISIIIMAVSNGNIEVNLNEVIDNIPVSQSQVQEVNEQGSFFRLKNGIQYYYKEENEKSVELVIELIEELPSYFTMNVNKIEFKGENRDIAGTATGQNIVLHNFESYSLKNKKLILYHEIAHTFGNMLKETKDINNYKEYAEEVKKDKNYVTDYSKSHIKDNENYSEDFADGFSYYFYSKSSFKKKYKNRTKYFENMLEIAKQYEIDIKGVSLDE